MVENQGNVVSKVKGYEIVLLLIASLFPYAVEGSDPMLFYMFFGYIGVHLYLIPELHFRMIFDFPPFLDIDMILEYFFEWSVFVIIPLILNILLILSFIRNKQSKGSIHVVRYFAIGGLAYSIGLSMMSEILPLPFTPIVFFILQTIGYLTNRKKSH
ncbi:MAG: hypothetical protein ACFFDQ_07295 [Candidatus Thorarchaeota archaeon]